MGGFSKIFDDRGIIGWSPLWISDYELILGEEYLINVSIYHHKIIDIHVFELRTNKYRLPAPVGPFNRRSLSLMRGTVVFEEVVSTNWLANHCFNWLHLTRLRANWELSRASKQSTKLVVRLAKGHNWWPIDRPLITLCPTDCSQLFLFPGLALCLPLIGFWRDDWSKSGLIHASDHSLDIVHQNKWPKYLTDKQWNYIKLFGNRRPNDMTLRVWEWVTRWRSLTVKHECLLIVTINYRYNNCELNDKL